jgi:hypothetical protein
VPTIVVSAWARREERAFAHPTDWFHGIDPLGAPWWLSSIALSILQEPRGRAHPLV